MEYIVIEIVDGDHVFKLRQSGKHVVTIKANGHFVMSMLVYRLTDEEWQELTEKYARIVEKKYFE